LSKRLSLKELLEIKTGELIAKTEDLREANESLRLANVDIDQKVKDIKRYKKDLTETEQSLIRANNKLIETNQNLINMNNEMIEVTKDLAMANEQIKQLALKQKEFIDITAHELRTPTQSILGYSEMIISEPNTNIEYIKIIVRNATRIQKLISNILDMATIDNLTIQLYKEQFSLPTLISTVVQDFRNRTRASKGNVDLLYDDTRSNPKEVSKDVIVEADKDRIAQVLINLVDNAIKFTDSGKIVITISTNVTNTDTDNFNHTKEIIIKVKDSGKGLNPEFISRIFEKFFTGTETGGIGLGLYICKAIIEAHGGRISAQNNKNEKGATFSFSLPLNERSSYTDTN